jgi:hypothetical protein
MRPQKSQSGGDERRSLFVPTCASNALLKYTEMEAKVREATNDDPWFVEAMLSVGEG